jgi:hypothetical protein
MGAVKTAGRGREVDASAKTLSESAHESLTRINVPPEEPWTFTVGREAMDFLRS